MKLRNIKDIAFKLFLCYSFYCFIGLPMSPSKHAIFMDDPITSRTPTAHLAYPRCLYYSHRHQRRPPAPDSPQAWWS